MKRTLSQWLSWQESLNPSEIDLGLDRVDKVIRKLQPHFFQNKLQQELPFTLITIGGTNGKGSTIEYLHSLLETAGYKVGVYTSPHFIEYNERIQINHQQISDENLCQIFEHIEEAREQTQLTYFEYGTLAAIQYFTEQQCDIVILEVGLGGRLDAVNVLDADCALVTTIALDHQDWLGDTIDKIAAEKAGIYRPEKIAIYGDENTPQSILDITQNHPSKLIQFKVDYDYQHHNEKFWNWQYNNTIFKDLPTSPIPGKIQFKNLSNALMVISALQRQNQLNIIAPETIKKGIVKSRLTGRLQIIQKKPLTIIDVAHNEQAALELKNYLRENKLGENKLDEDKGSHTVAIFSVLKDKDYHKIIEIMSSEISEWHTYTLNSPRALPANEISKAISDTEKTKAISNTEQTEAISDMGKIKVTCYNNFNEAYHACTQAGSIGRIIIFGSFLTVTDAQSFFHGKK